MRTHREGIRVKKDAEAFKLLGLENDPDTYTVQDVDSAWRTLRSELHPDRPEGDAARFDAARKAYDAARFYALEPKPCSTCDGKGKVAHPRVQSKVSFSGDVNLTFKCPDCKGRGER